MTKEYPHTFNEWMRGECGPVKTIEKEGYPHQSEYVSIYNYLRDKGWERDGNGWVSPRNGRRYTKKQAVNSQKLWDELDR